MTTNAGNTRRIVRNSACNLVGQVMYAIVHLLSIAVLARALGAVGFGQYYTIVALILVVQLLAEGGLSTILTCRLIRHAEDRRRTIAEGGGLFAIVSLLSIALLTAIGLGVEWWRDTSALTWAFVAAGVACAGVQVQRYSAGVLQASEQFASENIARVIQGVLFAASCLVLTTWGIHLTAVLAILAVSQWTAAGFLLATLRRRGWLERPALPRDWKKWVAEAGPLGVGDMVRGVTWQLDTVLLGLLQPAAAVGIYSVAYRPLGPLNWVPRAILSAAFPTFTRLAADRDALRRALVRSVCLLTAISLTVAIVIFASAERFVLLVAGPQYVESAIPLRLVIWITVLSFFTMHFRFVLAALGRSATYAWLVTGTLALEAIVELALIPRWGYMGAAAGSLLGELVFAVVGSAVCWRAVRRQEVTYEGTDARAPLDHLQSA